MIQQDVWYVLEAQLQLHMTRVIARQGLGISTSNVACSTFELLVSLHSD